MKELTGKLNNWSPQYNWIGELILWGDLEGDSKGRWIDGTRIHTSPLSDPRKDLCEGMTVETKYSLYLLGKPLPQED